MHPMQIYQIHFNVPLQLYFMRKKGNEILTASTRKKKKKNYIKHVILFTYFKIYPNFFFVLKTSLGELLY